MSIWHNAAVLAKGILIGKLCELDYEKKRSVRDAGRGVTERRMLSRRTYRELHSALPSHLSRRHVRMENRRQGSVETGAAIRARLSEGSGEPRETSAPALHDDGRLGSRTFRRPLRIVEEREARREEECLLRCFRRRAVPIVMQ